MSIIRISDQPKKNKSPWFAIKYPRETRALATFSPDNIPEEHEEYYPPPTDDSCYATTIESPLDGFGYFKEATLSESLMHFNPILAYRFMRSLYGTPDPVGGFIIKSENKSNYICAIDWSYILRLSNNIVSEIRSIFMNTHHIVRFWTDSEMDNEEKGKSMVQFLKDLDNAVSDNLHLFSEMEAFQHVQTQKENNCALSNVFAVKYKSAEQFFELAQAVDIKPERRQLKYDENPTISTAGSFYMASVLFFIISLESLLNTILEIFLYDTYRSESYGDIKKGNLCKRLCAIHTFCSCFKHSVLRRDSDLWKDIRGLIEYRNDIVHGNISYEDRAYHFKEDGILFFYSPVIDFRGRIEEDINSAELPRLMSSTGEREVMRVKKLVDTIISEILKAMDEGSKSWVKSWLYELAIPPKNVKRN